MPLVKKLPIGFCNSAGADFALTLSIYVSAAGEFYAPIPEYLLLTIPDKCRTHLEAGRNKVFAPSMGQLELLVRKALQDYAEPQVSKCNVIQYNIESHISFTIDKSGQVAPNAGFPGFAWPSLDKSMFGGHHAAKVCDGGYSLTIGAKAKIKTTCTYGDKSKVSYEPYYGMGDHHSHDCPASLLNSWTAFNLPPGPSEMPYSDEAATFFHQLMIGMASISLRIQNFASDETMLLEEIKKAAANKFLAIL